MPEMQELSVPDAKPAFIRRGSRSSFSKELTQSPSKGNMHDEAAGSVTEITQQLYENTYKMKPDKKFSGGALKAVLDDILKNNLTKAVYDAETVQSLTKKLVEQSIREVTKLGYPRYKFVTGKCQPWGISSPEVVIGEMKGQGIKVLSRCLWDTKTDSYISSSFRNQSLFAVIMVFGCFYE